MRDYPLRMKVQQRQPEGEGVFGGRAVVQEQQSAADGTSGIHKYVIEAYPVRPPQYGVG
jgi:hypothetical protein